jgi:ParB/RepB/Spo0J family partition protein
MDACEVVVILTTVQDIPIDKLKISDQNVRKDVGDVSELAQSIAEKGVLENIVVRPENGKYGVIIGSRRYTAAKQAKQRTVPAVVREMTDEEALAMSLVENLQRQDLQPVETTEGIMRLRKTYTVEQIAKTLGYGTRWVGNYIRLSALVQIVTKHDIEISKDPSDASRQAGKAIPLNHAIHLGNALGTPVIKKFFENMDAENAENKTVELAKALSPLTQTDTQKVLEVFKDNPDRPIETIVQQALIPEFIGGRGGIGGFGEHQILTAPDEWDLAHGKTVYNLKRIDLSKYKFFTIGYSHTSVEQFIEKLKIAGVKTLIDVRNNPQSIYRPEFNKERLESTLKAKGIRYLHLRELGVPSEQREDLSTEAEYKRLWTWYDKNVLHPFMTDNYRSHDLKADITPPFAYMCMELDPTKCHRHRIAIWHEEKGHKGLDL